jgi:hypothetical protein
LLISLLPLLGALAAPADTTTTPPRVEYRIEARLDEPTNVLHARARLRYLNRSGSTLDTLWLHQYLNAFRPNSAWARRDLEFGSRRVQDLGPEDHAYERFTRVEVAGHSVAPVYPGAPDSTVVGLPLPAPLGPGDSVTVEMDWDARLSTLPRRQGRRGRHYDFAQWYPRVAVFEHGRWQTQPLLPQGEFYGEFGGFDVTLDVASDQVIGATGVAVEGEPGWAGAAAPGFADSLFYRRDAYGAVAGAEPLGLLGDEAAPGRKRVRWRAEDVHAFVWSTAPDYRYEGGHYGDVAIHVLYQPGDTAWDEGAAVNHTRTTLQWLDSIYGPFAWPQITNVHRVEGGGTEFPMMVMNGGASLGLILHEVGHNYTMGILANNEWKEGFLDEGFTSFQTNWYYQTHGQPDVWKRSFEAAAQWDRLGRSQPLATPSAEFRDFDTYNAMTYTKPSVVYRMLQAYLGDEVFRAGLRRYYSENRLTHVDLADFQRAMEAASGQDLDWFFDEWFRTTDTLDYGLGAVTSSRQGNGRWRTEVEVVRLGKAWMPVELRVGGETRTLTSRKPVQHLRIETADRPGQVVLDPRGVLLDIDRSNNTRVVGG